MDKKLLAFLVCPLCKGRLSYDKEKQELQCSEDKLAFPIVDNIPQLLVEKARSLIGGES